jgi:hypothetical protein
MAKDKFGLEENEPRCEAGNGHGALVDGLGHRICNRAAGHAGMHQSAVDDSCWPNNDYVSGKIEDRGYPGFVSFPPANPVEVLSRPGVFVEVTGDYSINYEFLNLSTDEQVRIVREVLPGLLNRFLEKNKDYQDFPMADLGAKAHFVGIWRKVGKLKRGLWDGESLEHEQVSEVIDDLIGHLLLAKLGLTD